MIRFPALFIAFALSAGYLNAMEYLTGAWNGARQKTTDAGIDFFATYANDLMGNPVGGRAQGFTNAGALDTALTLDLEKLANIKGCTLFNSLNWCSGSSLSAKRIDNQFPVQQLYQGETWKLAELYLQESLFNNRLNIKAGRLCAGMDFIASPIYLKYVTGAINANPFPMIINAFFSMYPFSTWGACMNARIDPLQIKAGVFNTNPDIWKNKYHGFNFTFKSQHGVMWISEATYHSNQNSNNGLKGNYTIGGYYTTGKADTFSESHASGNHGYYVQFDQMLYRPNADQNLTSWGAVLFAPANRNPFPFFFAAGLVYQGTFSRPADALCLGIAYGLYSDDMRKAERKGRKTENIIGEREQSAETDIELNYWFQATQWLTLTPVVQYIINPKGYGTIQNALTAGIQIIIDL